MAKSKTLGIDIETYSDVDIRACGSFRYIDDPSFEVLLISYAFDDAEVRTIDLAMGDTVPEEFYSGLYDPDITKTAWNAAFERYALWKYFGRYCPPSEWEDTMVLSASCGLPLSLGQAGEALMLPQDKAKDKEGKELIRLFCSPRKPTKRNPATRVLPQDEPEKWEAFQYYNAQDVVAERNIRNLLIQWRPDETEHQIWALDARINERGIRADLTLAHRAIEMGDHYKEELTEEAVQLTGLQNPGSVAQIKDWLLQQEGLEVPSLNKKVVADVVAQLKTDKAKEFMALRKELAKSSVKKYDAVIRSAGPDDHIRGCFQFAGTRTLRWAGRLVQLQNLPQNHMKDLAEARTLVRAGDYDTVRALYDSVSSTLSELIRTTLIPEPGHRFVVADFSAIEARVTAWLSNEEWRLEVFRNGGDIYCASATQMFHVPVEKHGANSELRQKGKVAELALGYGGGVNALKAFGADKLGMSEEEMAETVAMWREASPKICATWRRLERAAIQCTVRHHTVESGIPGVRFEWEKGILWMTLPSGRRMAYFNAEYRENKRRTGKCLSYMGLDQTTKKWTRIETWGGKLTENLVQATARDCLRDSMLALEAEGWDIRAHVHDEVICTEPVGSARGGDAMSEIMGRVLPWAEGLPLKAEAYECAFYQKD